MKSKVSFLNVNFYFDVIKCTYFEKQFKMLAVFAYFCGVHKKVFWFNFGAPLTRKCAQ